GIESVFDGAHGGSIEATIDVEDFTADAGGHVRTQEGTGIADFFDGHVAAQRGLLLVGGEHLAEALDAGGSEGADRACGDGVDASTFRAKAAGQVAYASFQAGLGHAHHVVVGHGALGTQIGQGQDAAVATLHHWAAGLGQGYQAVGADIVGNLETFAGGDFSEVAIQLIARCEAHRVNDTVQAVPLFAQLCEDVDDIVVIGHVAREAQLRTRAPASGEFFNAALELVVLVSEGELGAFAVHGGGDARGDRQLAGDTDDQDALTGEKTHVLFLLLG